ncbi:MAG TPA: TolC family protein [Pirellulaceae bacterium]
MSLACLPSDWWRKLRVGTRGRGLLRLAAALLVWCYGGETVQGQVVQEVPISPVQQFAPVVRETQPPVLPPLPASISDVSLPPVAQSAPAIRGAIQPPLPPLPPFAPVLREALPLPEPLPISPELLRPDSDFPTWWHELVQRPLGDPRFALPMELDAAVLQAVVNSAQVRVLRDTAEITEWAIPRAQANFDPTLFTDSRYTGTSDPVGNKLTTGGPPRFIDETWYGTSGLRRRTLSGAQVELSQRLGFQDNNSQFFLPKNQATARLNLTVTQPLLKGAGQAYNNAVVVLANLDASMAHDDFSREMQSYLLDFQKAYWEIYLQRTLYVQRRRLRDEALDVVNELGARIGIDVAESQLARSRAAIANRETSMIRHDTNVKNAVAKFKALANDPFLDMPQAMELIPQTAAGSSSGEADLAVALSTALNFRPEVQQASKEITASCERLNVAKRDLLPQLNAVMGSYISGLQGNADFGSAYGNQFTQGRPTYWGGLTYEMPYNNRASHAQHHQRQLELSRATAKLQVVTANVRADVEVAVREVATTYREMVSAHQAMQSEQKQIDYLVQRWRLLAGDQQTAGIVLNDLLESQDRRAAAEAGFATAQVAHRIAWVNLRRATGTLIDCAAITGTEEVLPAMGASLPELPPPVGTTDMAASKPRASSAPKAIVQNQPNAAPAAQAGVRQANVTSLPGQMSQEVVVPWWMTPAGSNAVTPADFVTRLPPIDSGPNNGNPARQPVRP